MNRFKPYTIGILTSIFFHIPLFYLFINRTDLPKKEIAITIDPAIVECSIIRHAEQNYFALKMPPITMPPRSYGN